MWRRKRWLVIIVVIAVVFGASAIREFRISKLPPKERRLKNSQFSFRIASLKYRWGSRMVDGIEQVTGPIAIASQFADYLGSKKKVASDELRDASHFASIEIVGIYEDRHEFNNAAAKIHLKGLSRNSTFIITKMDDQKRFQNGELRVPNQFAEQARKILDNTEVCIVKSFPYDSEKEISQAVDTMRAKGVRAVSMSFRDDFGDPHKSIFVLTEDKEIAEQALESFPRVQPIPNPK